jgi:hypothetical protein
MTIDRMTLKALLEKGSDDDLLREMIGFVANGTMDLDVDGLTGAAYGERSLARVTQRNGYREQAWETRAGTVDLAIPKLRKGSYFPGFLADTRVLSGRCGPRPGRTGAGACPYVYVQALAAVAGLFLRASCEAGSFCGVAGACLLSRQPHASQQTAHRRAVHGLSEPLLADPHQVLAREGADPMDIRVRSLHHDGVELRQLVGRHSRWATAAPAIESHHKPAGNRCIARQSG